MNWPDTFLINKTGVGRGKQPYIIAEMACAHDGSAEKAHALVEASATAGAHAIQLQMFKTEQTVTPHHEVFPIIRDIEFTDEVWADLVHHSRDVGLDVLVCAYDTQSANIACRFDVDGFKLNSADLSNPDLLEIVGRSGKPFTLGTGASLTAEIKRGLECLQAAGAAAGVLMHGVQNFPTQNADLNVSRVRHLIDTFNMPVGYHDHTEGGNPAGLWIDAMAIGAGASVLEKHITLNRSEKGIDYQAALEPGEFKTYVANVLYAKEAFGPLPVDELTDSDRRYRSFQKKSIVAARELQAGRVITRDDVLFLRNTEEGLAPVSFEALNGRLLKRTIAAYENILTGDLEEPDDS